MQIEITKGEFDDLITITRNDGSQTVTRFPKKGIVPHDAVHYYVERVLGLKNAFWGMIAGGADPAEIQEIAKAAGHASAKRAREPEPHIIELLQAERIVECFEADMWSAPADIATFMEVIETACGYSHVPTPKFVPDTVEKIRIELRELLTLWRAAEAGKSIALDW